MMKNLYIFATSCRPDAYINSIAYSIEHKDVGSIYVIVIDGHDYFCEEQEDGLMATEVFKNIIIQLQHLKNGKYMYFGKKSGGHKIVDLQNKNHIYIYEKCIKVINKSGHEGKVIEFSKLDKELKEFVDRGNCIFDVSTLKKILGIKVMMTLGSYGFRDVYSFELKKGQKFDQSDLYHNLIDSDSFIYRNLSSIIRQKSKSKFFLWAGIIFLILIPLCIIWKDSLIWPFLNISAMVASITSFLYIYLKEKK
jgi:hypothetical protein